MFNPAKSSKNIKKSFIDYVTTALNFPLDGDQDIVDLGKKFKNELNRIICKGPYVDINTNYVKGSTINQLISEGVLSPLFAEIEKEKPDNEKYKKSIVLDRPLYSHQEKAIRLLNDNKNIVVTSGTGSGKTECFLYPLINSLLREKEAGTLSKPGVRAILIYPMNALANDQMKRLRKLLMKYPEIRFGVFNGDTPYSGDMKDWFHDLHQSETVEELKWPLPNEPLTREEMVKNPPHILCTNYAMLEFMLLTPNRGAVFAGADVKFIIMDEAHTYTGATGMETSLLIRRLIARINENNSHPQYVLTSATLGDEGSAEKDISNFAENLTGEKFGTDSIVFGHREPFYIGNENIDIPTSFFVKVSETNENDIEKIFSEYNYHYDTNLSYKDNLYNLCSCSSLYKRLRNLFKEPVLISTISNWLNISEDETVAFLHVCSLARQKNSVLVDLRFHFFVRTLEGFYYCLTGDKEAFLERKEYINKGNHEDRVFEISICKNCGDIALVGYIENENGTIYLKNRDSKLHDRREDEEPLFFHIVKSKIDENDPNNGHVDQQEADEKEAEFDDEEELSKAKQAEANEDKNYDDYYLCPHCGELSLIKDGYPTCKHDKSEFLHVRTYSKKVKHSKDRCMYCFNGEYNKFYIGTESATSVLATALFEQLPLKDIEVEVESPLPGLPSETIIKTAGKQFLAFSDSRAEAAYFASYLDKRYKTLMEKRMLVLLLQKNMKTFLDEDYFDETWNLNIFADKLSKLLHKNLSYIDDLLNDPKPAEHKQLCDEFAWQTILKELVTCKRGNSLQSLGFLKFEYLGNTDKIAKYFKAMYFNHLSDYDVKELLNELAMTFAYFGAVIPDSYDLSLETRKEVFFIKDQKGIQKSKSGFGLSNIGNWLPMARENDPTKYYRTYRQELVLKALNDNSKTDTCNKFLGEYFDYLTKTSNPYHAVMIDGKNPWFALPTSSITIKVPGHENVKWYRCKKCGRITTINFRNKCLISKCDGDLEEIDNIQEYLKENYYLKFYKYADENYCKKMLIKEHTAQLSKHDALEYQVKFEKNNINALSCSTTFEMGVDVGELETVFLRDIPPSTANYAQRAGRAGRSKDSAAFVLSFAKLSSHDFNYYEDPKQMINGEINPPYFKLNNPKIVFRHIYSTIFGYFFNKFAAYFEDSDGKQRPISHFIEEGGYNEFVKMLKIKENELSKVLHDSFADLDDEFGISDFSGIWIDELIGNNGRLKTAIDEYNSVVKDFKSDIEAIEKAQAPNYRLRAGYVEKEMERYKGTSIIDFLVDANVLPKYGFPVDTVELKIGGEHLYDKNTNRGLRLNRDMTQAISDYAPGSKIIADNKMYTARYISRYWKNGEKDFDKLYISYCSDCGTLNVSYTNTPTDKKCEGCGISLNGVTWEEAISPSAGMITDGRKPEEVPLTRPKKVYRSDFYYIEEDHSANKVALDLNSSGVTVISSRKDKIIVTSAKGEPFYVCPKCGFAYGRYDKIRDKNGKVDKVATSILQAGTNKELPLHKTHFRPNGKPCNCKTLERKSLYHAFNTDIIQIIFDNEKSIDETTAVSVLFSLIDAISNVLEVERNEISGVIRCDNMIGCSSNYRFILFDNVPGGAGHVKRILENNYLRLADVINYAYEKSLNCTCDPKSSCYKCLRTYDNQKYHDILSRDCVVNFLKPYAYSTPKKHVSTKINLVTTNPFPYTNWESFFKTMKGYFSKNAEKIISSLKLPEFIFAQIEIDGKVIDDEAVLCWPNEGIYIFAEGTENSLFGIKYPQDVKFLIGNDELKDNDVSELKGE